MKPLLVLGASFLVLGLCTAQADDERFRPEFGKFPPADKAESLMGELTFVDYEHRRGSLRVVKEGNIAYRAGETPFAMLPYGMVRYRGAPADLRDIPLGTVMHGRFYLPPDPRFSLVPDVNTANHAILLEDESSFCQREGLIWKLKEIEIRGDEGMIVASRESKDGNAEKGKEEKLTVDSTTHFWLGREKLFLTDMISEGLWPESGKKPLGNELVYLGLSWQPIAEGWGDGIPFNRYHISDIWLDDEAVKRAQDHQTEVHKELLLSRWMPAWVDEIKYGQAGKGEITVTLFGGMDPSLYAKFREGERVNVGAATVTLKHADGVSAGIQHASVKSSVLEIVKHADNVPLGSSGIQLRMKVDILIEGFRPGRIVRIGFSDTPRAAIPRNEYIIGIDEFLPSAEIYNKFKR